MPAPSPSVTLTPVERAALGAAAERACAAARAAGGPVLLSCAVPLAACDPLALLEALGAGAEALPAAATAQPDAPPAPFRFHWERPGAGLALAAGGVVQPFSADGPQRFRLVAEQVQAALRQAVSATLGGAAPEDGAGPYVLGGFSFFDQVAAAHWPGFGAARLVVPAWLVLRQAGACQGIVSVRVAADAAPADLTARLAVALEALRAAAEAPAPEHANGRNRAFRSEAREDGHARWLEVVRLARDRIRSGALSKVVLARALDLVCEAAPSPFGLLRRLRAAYPDCFNFLVDPGAGQVFLGATPELMARFGGGRVHLAAVAGTVPRGPTPDAEAAYARYLRGSRKEREEHQIVVDGILASLQGLGRVDCPEQPAVLKLSNVQHLYTPITLSPAQPLPMLALLERLHPTPAVGGHPREEALALIRESERFERGWYAAPVGWINRRGEGEFAVALRSGTLAGNRLQLFAGGGIVADSDPEREYEETQIKFQPLLSALASE